MTSEPAKEIILHGQPVLGKKVELNGTIYEIVKANSGDGACVSFVNPETKLFLRHKRGSLCENRGDDPSKFFPLDSSFVLEAKEGDEGEGFVAHCSNPGMERQYICSIGEVTALVNSGLKPYFFSLGASKKHRQKKVCLVQGRNILGMHLVLGASTYVVLPGTIGESGYVSLQNTKTKLFLRHRSGKICESSPQESPKSFPMDSSFEPVERGAGFVLRCSNPGFEEHFICKVDAENYIVNPGLMAHIFPVPSLPWAELGGELVGDKEKNDFAAIQFEAASSLAQSDLFSSADAGNRARCADPLWQYVSTGLKEDEYSQDPAQDALVLLNILCPYSVTLDNCVALQSYLETMASGYLDHGLGEKLYDILKVARIDVSAKGSKEKPLTVKLDGGSDPHVTFLDFMKKAEGNGCRIESNCLETDTTFTCEQAGEVTIVFRSKDLRKYDQSDQRISLWTQYLSAEILLNGKVVKTLDTPFLAMHDKINQFTLKVNDKDRIGVKATWAPCFHNREALFEIMQTLDVSVSQIQNSF